MARLLPSIAVDNFPEGGNMATTVYFEMLMDHFQAGEILALRKKTLQFWEFLSLDEQTRILELCKGCEDWDYAYFNSLEPKAQGHMLKLHAMRLTPEEAKELYESLKMLRRAS
jgi:hypothetical protein